MLVNIRITAHLFVNLLYIMLFSLQKKKKIKNLISLNKKESIVFKKPECECSGIN